MLHVERVRVGVKYAKARANDQVPQDVCVHNERVRIDDEQQTHERDLALGRCARHALVELLEEQLDRRLEHVRKTEHRVPAQRREHVARRNAHERVGRVAREVARDARRELHDKLVPGVGRAARSPPFSRP